MRLIAAATVLSLGCLLVSCAGGEPAADAGDPPGTPGAVAASAGGANPPPTPAADPASPAPATGTDDATKPAPATQPAPATPGAGAAVSYPSELAAHSGLRIDCQQDNECAVKDVGNCCGRYDACVRADAQPDAAAVQAECAAKGLVGICGFPVIEACVCTAGTCQAAPSDGTGTDAAVK